MPDRFPITIDAKAMPFAHDVLEGMASTLGRYGNAEARRFLAERVELLRGRKPPKGVSAFETSAIITTMDGWISRLTTRLAQVAA